MSLFADLSLRNLAIFRITGYIFYWVVCIMVCIFVLVGTVVSVLNLIDGEPLPIYIFVFSALCLLIGYWVRRGLTSVRSIWPWVTLARQLRDRPSN